MQKTILKSPRRARSRRSVASAVGALVATVVAAGIVMSPVLAAPGDVSTLAGDGRAGYIDGAGASAQFTSPYGVAVDGSGNVYVAEITTREVRLSNRIRKIDSEGVVSTLAGGTSGFADGPGTSAQFFAPFGVAVDGSGNVYVADRNNHRIRKIDSSGVVSTIAGTGTAGFADGPGTSAQFNFPCGVAVDGLGNVYVGDCSNHRIRKVESSGVVSTLAGTGTAGFADGPGASAQFDVPYGVVVDGSGNVYVGDSNNHRIRKIDSSGVVSTLAGDGTSGFADGPGTSAQFNTPRGLAVDGLGNVYVADLVNHRIRKIDSSGVVSTLAGEGTPGFADGSGTSAQFYLPNGVAVDGSGNVYVADAANNRIRKIAFTVATTTTTTTVPETTTTVPAPTTTSAPTSTSAPTTTSAPATTVAPTTTVLSPIVLSPVTTPTIATNVVPSTTTPAAVLPVAPSTKPDAGSVPVSPVSPVSPVDGRPNAVVESGSHVEGQAVTITGNGYRPNTVVTVVLPSTGVTLGTATTDATGAFSLIATLPIGTTGKQMVRVLGVSVENSPFTVNTEVVVAPATAQELALTGSNTALIISIAFGLMLAGLLVTRRSRTQRP